MRTNYIAQNVGPHHIFASVIITVQNQKSISFFFSSEKFREPLHCSSDIGHQWFYYGEIQFERTPSREITRYDAFTEKREIIGYFISAHMTFWSDKTTMLIFLVFNFTYNKVNESIWVSVHFSSFFLCRCVACRQERVSQMSNQVPSGGSFAVFPSSHRWFYNSSIY